MERTAIEPERLVIRSFEPPDAPAVCALMGSPGVFEQMMQLPDMPDAWRMPALQREDPNGCRLVALVDGQAVAQAGLWLPPATLRRQHVRMLVIGVAHAWQGRGIGPQLMQRLLDWADNWAGVLRVELWVNADNAAAIGLYRRFGFVEEGRMRGYVLRGGRYIDGLSMARLHPSPPAIQ